MIALINKVELKKSINNYYFKIELTDLNGNIHIINKPFLNDPINFRKQVFGIMAACGNYDLLTLATDNPIKKRVIGYYINGLQMLENEKSEWLTYDKELKEFKCARIDKKKKKIVQTIAESHISDIMIEEGNIECILSESGTIQLLFKGENITSFYLTGQIYYGFGYPLNIGDEKNIVTVKESSQKFTSFIVSLMHFYGTNDLLHFGGNINKLPIVNISLNNNQVESITNMSTGLGLSIGKDYNIVDKSGFQKVK